MTLRTNLAYACQKEKVELKCPESTVIGVQTANYGRRLSSRLMCPDFMNMFKEDFEEDVNCHASNSLQTLVNLCDGKRECAFRVTDEEFGGDPCPGTSKYAEVTYKCKPRVYIEAVQCEDQQMQLVCNNNELLAIKSAMFGREANVKNGICPSYSMKNIGCDSQNAVEEMMMRCHGRRQCTVKASTKVFKAGCEPGTDKYLKVVYACVPKKVFNRPHRFSGMPESAKNIRTQDTEIFGTQKDAPSPVTEDVAHTPVAPGKRGAVDHAQTEGSASLGPSINIYPPKVSNRPRGIMAEITTESWMAVNSTSVQPGAIQGRGIFTSMLTVYGHIASNKEEFILYVVLGVCIGMILALIFFVFDLKWKNKKLKKKVKSKNPASDSGNNQSTTGSGNDHTDNSRPRTVHLSIDEADRMDINELWRTMTPTSTLQRRENNNNRVTSQVWSTPPPHLSSREDNSHASSDNGPTNRQMENSVHHSLERGSRFQTLERDYGGYARIPTIEPDSGLYARIDSPPQTHATTSFTYSNHNNGKSDKDEERDGSPHYRPNIGRDHKTLERSASSYDNGPVYSQPREHPFKINSSRKPQPATPYSGLYATVQPKSMRNGGSNANRLDRSTSLSGQPITTSVQEVDQRQQYSVSGAIPKQTKPANGIVHNQDHSIPAPMNNDSGVGMVVMNSIGHEHKESEQPSKQETEPASTDNLEFDLDHALENILGPGFGNFNDIWNRDNLPGTQNLNSYF
ncbi:uncharacterized protein LOC117113573 isoform X2 [Anneissia japonica]|uniref:uncharacterized protein LOC117113573 isoform X2 n=1 Tax=Anneissia japonica TaxID=1529436 RepID=UPI001425B0F2|nr:uncharacterized protein LOC117113573 isoform X2 [Anneissia japonica]